MREKRILVSPPRHRDSRSYPIASGAAMPGTISQYPGGRRHVVVAVAVGTRLVSLLPLSRLPRPRWTQWGDPQSATGSRTACTPSTGSTKCAGTTNVASFLRESRSNRVSKRRKKNEETMTQGQVLITKMWEIRWLRMKIADQSRCCRLPGNEWGDVGYHSETVTNSISSL